MTSKMTFTTFFSDWLGLTIYSNEYEKQYIEQFNRFVECKFELIDNETIYPTNYNLAVFKAFIDSWASNQINQSKRKDINQVNSVFISYPKSRDSFTGLHFGYMSEKISINTASVEELRQIPGIGNSSARTIDETRKVYGHFQNLDELISKKCISAEAFQNCKSYITISDNNVGDNILNEVYVNFSSYVLFANALANTHSGINISEFALNEMSKAVKFYIESSFDHYTSNRLSLSNSFIEEGVIQLFDLEGKNDRLQTGILNSFNYLKLLNRIIPKAKESIYIQAPSLNLLYLPTLKILLDMLVKASHMKIDVRLLYDGNYSPTALESDDIAYLFSQNVPCKGIKMKNRVHSRVIVIDNEHIICGSQSWSSTSFYHSQECSIYINSKDLAKKQTKRFLHFWENF
jgi:competence ComEA-like helix-hairpin-helix protein